MISRLKNAFENLFRVHSKIDKLNVELESQRILLGKFFSDYNKDLANKEFQDFEFKIFSQYGDDGLIQYLINKVKIKNRIFIEFGVQNYTESNTRFLLINNNWSGLILDGSKENIDYVKQDIISRKYDISATCAFITKENINELISNSEYSGDIGILSIDIDGNDYWIWKVINVVNPTIVICEYNSVFGSEKPWTVPYNPLFERNKYHYSNLCYGSSLLSLWDLAEEKGYDFIGCNSMGNNAYFVKKEFSGNLKKPKVENGYVLSKFSESRDIKGNWTNLKGADRLDEIIGCKVYNTRSNEIETIG